MLEQLQPLPGFCAGQVVEDHSLLGKVPLLCLHELHAVVSSYCSEWSVIEFPLVCLLETRGDVPEIQI